MARRKIAGAAWWSDGALVREGPSNCLQGVDIRPRLRVRRLRAGLSLRELSGLTGLNRAFLTRIERDPAAVHNLTPGKMHEIFSILNKIGVTEVERRAVFFREKRPLAPKIAAEEVSRFAARVEHAEWPMGLLDQHQCWL